MAGVEGVIAGIARANKAQAAASQNLPDYLRGDCGVSLAVGPDPQIATIRRQMAAAVEHREWQRGALAMQQPRSGR